MDEESMKKAQEQEARHKKEQAEEEARLYDDMCRRYHVPEWISLDKKLVDEYIKRRTNCWIMLTFGRMLYELGLPEGCEYKVTIADVGIKPEEYWRWQVEENFGIKMPEENDEKQ